MIRWWRQYWAIARNAFLVSLGDPVYLVLLLVVVAAMAFFATLPTFAFGQELRLIRDQSLALNLLGGVVLAALATSVVVLRDLQQGALSVLMSRPVSSFCVMTGKWSGLAGALLLYQITTGVAVLWMTRAIAVDNSEAQYVDHVTLCFYFGSILLALAGMAVKHYFFGGWYVWQANVAVCGMFVLAFAISSFLGPDGQPQAWGHNVDWSSAAAVAASYFALLVFLSCLLPVAVRANAAILFGCAAVIFAVGMLSEFAIDGLFGAGWLGDTVKALLPNWQIYWLSDMLASEKRAPVAGVLRFLSGGMVHALCFAGLSIIGATLLFDRRELSGDDTL